MAGLAQPSAVTFFLQFKNLQKVTFYIDYSTAVCNNRSNFLIENVEQKGISHND